MRESKMRKNKVASEIYSGTAGTAYGHVPGHNYHDVDCEIRRSRLGGWQCTLTETWGSAQGYDEEHGRNESTGIGETPSDAATEALDGIDEDSVKYARAALAQALRASEEVAS